MDTLQWLEYPSEFRITFEEQDLSEPNILIGSEKNDTTYTKWVCTFVVNKPSGEFYMIENIKFGWNEVSDYPEMAPTFNLNAFEGTRLDKFKILFNSDGKLLKWNSDMTIRQNLIQLLILL
jgi:hypothetical protein